MKAIKRKLSILLAVLMVIGCINPYAVQVRAEEKNPVEILSKEASEAEKPDKEKSLPESSQEEKQEADEGALKEAEIKEENKEEAKEAELAVRGKTQEELKAEAYTEDDFWTSGVSFTGLTPNGKEKLKAKDGVLEFPELKTKYGSNISIIQTDAFTFKKLGIAIKKLTIPNTITEIGMSAFYGNELTELSIPASVKEIKPSAFARNQISQLNLSEGLEKIFPFAFEYNQLKEVVIPDTVTEIRKEAFGNNPGDGGNGKVTLYIKDIDKVTFPYDDLGKERYNIQPKSNGNSQEELKSKAYTEDDFKIEGVCFNSLTEQGKEKLKAKNGVLEIPVLKASNGNYVSKIERFNFRKLGIKQLIIPDTIKEIGRHAFYENEITELTIPGSVSDIEDNVFAKNQISKLTLSEGVKRILPSAFEYNQLKEVVIPDSVTDIRNAFEKNPGDGTLEDGKYGKVTLYIKDVSKVTFTYNSPDRYIIKSKSNENLQEEYVAKDFTYVEKSENGKSFIEITGLSVSGQDKRKKNHVLNIPSVLYGKEVKSITKRAFTNKKMNQDISFTAVTLPNKLETIGEEAFTGNSLTKITFPDTLKVIESEAFSYNKLTEVFIPNSVQKIEMRAFADNEIAQGKAKIDNIKGKVELGYEAFGEDVEPVFLKTAPKFKIEIIAPKGVTITTTPEKQAEESQTVKINYTITDNSKELLSLKVRKGKYGNVAVSADNSFTMPKEDVTIELRLKDKYTADKWCVEDFIYERYELGDIDDEYYINEITVKGFSDKGLKKLKGNKELVLPEMNLSGEKVESVFDEAFINKGITKLTVPSNYVKIYKSAFKDNKISKLILNEGIVDIHENVFENNELTEFIAPKTKFRYAGNAAFKNNKIKKVVLTDNVKTVAAESFMNNEISELVLGNRLERIASKAFSNNKLTEVNIPITLKKPTYYSLAPIEKDAFDNNPGMANPLKPSENKVLLWTPDKNNPNKLPNGNNYVVDPVKQIDEYLPQDFKYTGKQVSGFSKEGEEKYKRLGDKKPIQLPSKNNKGDLITGIADEAFDNQTPEIKKIKIPYGYTTIGQAFAESEIESVQLPDTITDINDLAFYNSSNNVVKLYVRTEAVKKQIKTQASNYWKIIVDNNTSAWEVSDFTYGEEEAVKEESNGTKTPIKLKAVTGFSAAGLKKLKTVKDLVLPTLNDKGEKLEAVASRAFIGNLEKRLDTLTIPEGYVLIGPMAFGLNKCGGDLVLPESVEAVGLAAFYRNEFTSLTTGTKLINIPQSMMLGNKLTNVTFKGNIETIGRIAFKENRLTEVKIPDSLKKIDAEAFAKNTGVDSHNDKVVLRTASGNNPQKLPDKENYIIDPSNQGTDPNINYNVWTTDDFTYKGTKVTGFSEQGLKKIKRNKKLVVPDKTPDGKNVLSIGIDAFRSLGTNYEIESVKLPDTVQEIGNYALQFNDLTEVTLPKDLKKLGWGVFMNNKLTTVHFNDKLEYIDQICFVSNDLGKIELPASVHTIMNAAFRRCGLTEVKFAQDSQLKIIDSLVFADNELTTIELPTGIEKIGFQAFGNKKAGIGNKFTELSVPDTLKEIGFQAFANNPGVAKYNAVVIHTPNDKNPAGLVDDPGKTFVIDPEVVATLDDKAKLKVEIDKAAKIDSNKLTEKFQKFFVGVLDDAKAAYADTKASKAKVLGLVNDLSWAVKRAQLNRLMFEKEVLDPKADTLDKEKWGQVEEAYKAAKKYLMVVNITDGKLNKLIHDLDVALQNLNGQGDLKDADVYEGEAHIGQTHYIEPYDVKVKVWVKDGKIVFVKDNGTVCDDPSEDEEHNRGYFETAIEILYKYIGKDVKIVKNSRLGSKDLNIKAISGATVSSVALDTAIKNALGKIAGNPNPPIPNPQTPDPVPPTVDPSPDNGGFIPPSDSGSSSGGSSGGGSIGGTARTENTIKDDETPLAKLPTEKKALVLKNKNKIKLTDKQLSDLIIGKYTHMELTIGDVSLKIMPKDIKPFFKNGKDKSYLKIRKLSEKEIKRLKLDKNTSKEAVYKVELIISGEKVTKLKNKVSVQISDAGGSKKDMMKILLAESNKTIKAKYNKKADKIEFKTNQLDIFAIMN